MLIERQLIKFHFTCGNENIQHIITLLRTCQDYRHSWSCNDLVLNQRTRCHSSAFIMIAKSRNSVCPADRKEKKNRAFGYLIVSLSQCRTWPPALSLHYSMIINIIYAVKTLYNYYNLIKSTCLSQSSFTCRPT